MTRVDNLQLQEALRLLTNRLGTYSQREVLIEIGVIFLLVYAVLRYLRGTRGARAIKGMALILIVITALAKLFIDEEHLARLNFLYGNLLIFAALAMVVVFQPELRRAMVRLGETRLFPGAGIRRVRVVDEIAKAVTYLSKNKIGALIAMEREVGLRGIIEAGVEIDATVSKELLCTIFWPGSALHDMGVIIREGKILAAGVQFPLAEADQFDTELGSRHRAAVGLSQEGDALIVVVSEETGTISIAERGRLVRNLTVEDLRDRLLMGLGRKAVAAPPVEEERDAA